MDRLSFSYRAVAPDGREVVDRVVAASAAAALAALHEQGLRDVQLLDDENSAARLGAPGSARRLEISARDEMAMRRQRSLSARVLWVFRRHAWVWGPLSAWLVYASWRDGWSLPAWPAALLFDARAHYGLALARLGRAAEAKAHFKAAYPMLKARGDAALIDRCKAAYQQTDAAR